MQQDSVHGKTTEFQQPHLLRSTGCSDITNTLVGISSETALDGRNRPIYFVYSGAIYPVVVLFHSWCVTPHSSPTRGCWPRWPLQPILNILNISTINIYTLDRE